LDGADKKRLKGVKIDVDTKVNVLPIWAQMGDILGRKLIHLYVIKYRLKFKMVVF
jgi:hypothetical protein